MRYRTAVAIGDKKCDLNIIKKSGEYHGELLVDGEMFDMTATCGDDAELAEDALSRMVARYQAAIKENTAFGQWARDVFMDK